MFRPTFQHSLRVAAALSIAAMLTGMLGCESKEAWQQPGPEATFEEFLLDWYRNDRSAAFEAIAPEDRQALLEPYDKLEQKLDDAHLPDKSEMIVAGRVDNPYDLKKVALEEELEEAPRDGERVTLELSYHDGRTGKATMIWGGERWFVDLPAAAEPGQAPKTDAQTDAGQHDDGAQDSGGRDAGAGAGTPDGSSARPDGSNQRP